MNPHRTEVLVIGAGPAGATAAFELSRRGIEALVVDRATFPREKVCGESLSPGAVARLHAIGMWQPPGRAEAKDAARSPAAEVRGMRVSSPKGTTFEGLYRGGSNRPGLAIRRLTLDAELLGAVRSRGLSVLEGIEVIGADQPTDGTARVRARAVGSHGVFTIEARRVMVADGRGSFLARELGFVSRRRQSAHRYAVRAHCENVAGLSTLAEMHVSEGGYCGIAPLSSTTANVCYVLFANRLDMRPAILHADFRRHLLRFPKTAQRLANASVLGEIRVMGPLRLESPRQTSGAFIACGDTTGFLDPFTGEGIAHAVASGVHAAEAVFESLAGRPAAFRNYEAQIRGLRRIKGRAAWLLYALVSRPALANAAASVFARAPRLGDAVVQMFGDQI